MPCKGKISSDYGMRYHPTLKEYHLHDGIDIAVPIGTEVKAVADGKVIKAKWNGGYGNYIEIDHGNGIHSFYGHLSEYKVSVGDIVKKRQIIALSGNTAGVGKNGVKQSTGPHVHLGARLNKNSVNPKNYLK